ncbi:hypothetical protein P0R31_15450 [Bradyrhizobium yuanmingense]|nr:hypothetical protein [Bradyrhizobium yuanmingense]MDF0518627.1 hypothetical protein [Bradyrhizobium yuanmingense]MDF0579765.1 hypothetical protein [Bradyrhizobium yuanmingense]
MSMLVDAINHRLPSHATQTTVLARGNRVARDMAALRYDFVLVNVSK